MDEAVIDFVQIDELMESQASLSEYGTAEWKAKRHVYK
jgi:hypothetical protein